MVLQRERWHKELMRTSVVVMATLLSQSQFAQTPTESQHVKGPVGLEGWILLSSIPSLGEAKYPTDLFIARHGRIVRRIKDGPFVWKWMFLPDGKRVAYEAGSLHFNLNCFLEDIGSGRILATYDCYHDPLGDKAPSWAIELENLLNRSLASRKRFPEMAATSYFLFLLAYPKD